MTVKCNAGLCPQIKVSGVITAQIHRASGSSNCQSVLTQNSWQSQNGQMQHGLYLSQRRREEISVEVLNNQRGLFSSTSKNPDL